MENRIRKIVREQLEDSGMSYEDRIYDFDNKLVDHLETLLDGLADLENEIYNDDSISEDEKGELTDMLQEKVGDYSGEIDQRQMM